MSAGGAYTFLFVEDPAVTHPSSDHFAARILSKNAESTSWIEVGWIEFGNDSDRQQIYTYDNATFQWSYYGDTYPISPYTWIEVLTVYAGNNVWRSFLDWNGSWQLLREVNLGFDWAPATEAFGEVYSASGNLFDAGAEFSSVELWYGTDWQIWTTSVPTLEVTNPPYDAYYWSKYDHFAFWKP